MDSCVSSAKILMTNYEDYIPSNNLNYNYKDINNL
jgi:hypothetical protein